MMFHVSPDFFCGSSLADFTDPFTGRTLSLSLAEGVQEKASARNLVAHMYARRGYPTHNILPDDPHYITLLLTENRGRLLGTVTVGAGRKGLRAEESYPEEMRLLQDRNRSLCEFNALAVLPETRSSYLLARLFHTALLLGETLGHTDGVVEVTRAHARFYERILGFVRAGEGRKCSRVGVPSVLLKLDFKNALLLAESCGERGRKYRNSRKFYSLVFGGQATRMISDRLSTRLIASARNLLTDRCNEFAQNLLEEEPSVLSQFGHPPSVPA